MELATVSSATGWSMFSYKFIFHNYFSNNVPTQYLRQHIPELAIIHLASIIQVNLDPRYYG
jgi:hypothetical protein